MNIKKIFPGSIKIYVIVAVLIYAVIRLSMSFINVNIMGNIIDENIRKNQFKQGYACYADYKPKGEKGGGAINESYYYYFYIDGKKSQNLFRRNYPFYQEWNNFQTNLDRSQCYRIIYLEAKFLFFTQRRIYQAFDKKVPSPYFKKEN